jgi:UDP-GlcNAc:undecaprenyl-phosphate GlcNAc-1-phosphate transferase
MRLGHGHWRTVLILWGWTAALSVLVLYPVYNDQGSGVLPFFVIATLLLLYTLLRPQFRRRERATVAVEPEPPATATVAAPATESPK